MKTDLCFASPIELTNKIPSESHRQMCYINPFLSAFAHGKLIQQLPMHPADMLSVTKLINPKYLFRCRIVA